jgi:beta-phosphoglucomutase-like phosphatase (HAD superfamily)
VAFVTTTSADNVQAVLAALDGIDADAFDLVLSADDVPAPKPDPAVYLLALEELGLSADEAVAVEDNVDGVAAASAAGISCIAFPNENTADHDFSNADRIVDELEPELIG